MYFLLVYSPLVRPAFGRFEGSVNHLNLRRVQVRAAFIDHPHLRTLGKLNSCRIFHQDGDGCQILRIYRPIKEPKIILGRETICAFVGPIYLCNRSARADDKRE